MTEWLDYSNPSDVSTVSGSLRMLPNLYSPQLDNERIVLVYLPPSYHSDMARRYPVIYMQDGQNLFDQQMAFSDEWQVDETLLQLAEEGIEAIVVGVANNDDRIDEYSPFADPAYGGGKGNEYLAFLADTLKPLIDRDFRTLPQRETTGILGSSMGGLISLYGFLHAPHVFGFAGALSPAIWFAEQALLTEIDNMEQLPAGKIYLDAGRQELSESPNAREKSMRYVALVRQLFDHLTAKGFAEGQNLMYVEDHGGTHREQDWARRLPDALRFLLTR